MNAETIIKMACRGNIDAERFCRAWVNYCHLIDDIEDKDKSICDEHLADVLTTWTIELSGNPFFLAHRSQLVPLMVAAANAWLDSNRLKCDTAQHQAQRDVLKGFWHEAVYYCAYIIGGFRLLRQVTSEARDYDFEPFSEKGGA